MKDVAGFESFVKIEPVLKGWSGEKKYCIKPAEEKKLLLRVASGSEYERKKAEYEMMKRVSALGIPIPEPIAFGTIDDDKSVYILLSWCGGEDAEAVLPRLPETEQYVLGIRSGKILRKIHSIPAPETQEEWSVRFSRKANKIMERYRACGIRFDGDDKIMGYIESGRYLLSGRPQCLQHGDYHVGNMVISRENTLSVIDFNRWDYGDPWEEFNRIVWSAAASPPFATGQLNGYFSGRPPLAFFRLLAFYIASNTLSSIPWAIPFGEADVDKMKNRAKDVLTWFDDMKTPVPSWYSEDCHAGQAVSVSDSDA
jgi:serine/threonine-protein kinase